MRRKKKSNQGAEDGDDQNGSGVQEAVNTLQEAEINIVDTSRIEHEVEHEQSVLNVGNSEAETVMKVGALKVKWWKLWFIAIVIMNLNINMKLQLKGICGRSDKIKRKGVVRQLEALSGWCCHLTEARTGVG